MPERSDKIIDNIQFKQIFYCQFPNFVVFCHIIIHDI